MKFSTIAIAAALGTMCASSSVYAGKGGDDAIDDDLSRRGPNSTSGSGHTVEGNCGGPEYQGATGKLVISQENERSDVTVEIEDAVPNTHFTVWVRIKGAKGLLNDAGSPWTGGGATPLCSGTEHAVLNAASPWNSGGSLAGLCNSFFTDGNGDGTLTASVNFPVVGGAYPFHQSFGAASHPTKGGGADVPTAIADPRTGLIGTDGKTAPFLIRVVSHCTDDKNHGLSPATREAFFQYP
jgi:hypothetical protein